MYRTEVKRPSLRQLVASARQRLQSLWQTPLEQLRRKYPWPARRPDVAPSERGWDGGGRQIVTDLLTSTRAKVVLEIGVFLGLSVRTWLKASPSLVVICLDPWDESIWDWYSVRTWTEVDRKRYFETFLSSCWEFRDRIIPIQGRSPEALELIHAANVHPDLIYIDGDHAYEAVRQDLEAAYRYFPHAQLAGDDWNWDKNVRPPRSVQEAVIDFAAAHQFRIRHQENTWALLAQSAGPQAQ